MGESDPAFWNVIRFSTAVKDSEIFFCVPRNKKAHKMQNNTLCS